MNVRRPIGFGISALLLSLLVASPAVNAAPPTFAKDVAPIMHANCVACHRDAGRNLSGMIAPMSFETYREVRPWSKAIKRVVASREMPPWHASAETHNVFRNERTLTDDEIATIVDWVDAGCPKGNLQDVPKLAEATTGWSIGEPDLLLEFKEPYWVGDDVEDIQPTIMVEITEEQLPEPRWISALEFKPGSEVVHHIVTFILSPDEELDLQNRKMLGRIAPGTDPQSYDPGYGFLLKPGSKMVFAMHYHKESGPGTGAWDSSQMAIKFHDKPVTHPVDISAIQHGDFEIPPLHPNWRVGGSQTFDEDFILLDLFPHMHLRGKSAKYTAFYPDGTSEELLDVERYDYNWQTAYEYDEYRQMPAGTRIEWEITYDNSEANAEARGINPNRAVRFGGPTTEEMDLGFFSYALAEPHKTPAPLSQD